MQKLKTKNCQNCNETYVGHPSSKFCSDTCYQTKVLSKKIKPDPNKVCCKVCGIYSHQLSSHIKTHNLTAQQYKDTYNSPLCSETYLQNSSKRIKGDKNPGYNHNGKLSPFSKKFVKYKKLSDEEITKTISEMATDAQYKSKENGNLAVTKEYFIKHGYTEEEAKNLLKKRQTTFNKDICIEKYGEEKGIERWNKRQEKWLKSYKKNNFSKISQQLFWSISNKLNDISNIYFAELDKNKQKDSSGVNHEFRLTFPNKTIQPDFIDIENKKIIEFDGDYWHGKEYSNEREQQRDELIYNNGYQVLHVKEYQYKENPEKILNECLNYLTQ
jgi:hypothetical protein